MKTFLFCIFLYAALHSVLQAEHVNRTRWLYVQKERFLEVSLVPAGQFYMGTDYSLYEVPASETPRHQVVLSHDFWIGKYEITKQQWLALFPEHNNVMAASERPVSGVTYSDAQEFCKRLSEKTGCSVRLPFEAEWEYACRAGSETLYYWGNGPDSRFLWYNNVSDNRTHHVGSKLPNQWGIFDMSGNVWEWCSDWFEQYPYAEQYVDPTGPAEGEYRIIRGGGYLSEISMCRSAYRTCIKPEVSNTEVGFRVVVEFR